MKLKIILGILISIFIFASSCQKQINGLDPLPPTPVDSVKILDSSYLDKLYELDANGTGFDTTAILTIHYDNWKRVISLNDSEVTTVGLAEIQSFYYYYNGTDTLPNKSVEIYSSTPGFFDTLTSFHFYDTQKRNLKDSIIGADHAVSSHQLYKIVTDFSYAPGKLYGQTTVTDIEPTGSTTFSRDTADIDANGNILKNKLYLFAGASYIPHAVSDFTYDSHLNPFAKIGIYKAHRGFPSGETLFFDYMGYNNIVSQNENTEAGNIIENWKNTYTYNAAGFPVIQIVNVSFGGGIGNIQKYIFKYKAL
jgi:hypothetical protein